MLTGEAKKAYQKEYMRDYMKTKRSKQISVKTPSVDVKTLLRPVVTHDVPLVPMDNPQVVAQKPVFSTEVRYRANGVPFHPVIGWE